MEQPNYFSILPATVRYDEELKANEKILYSEITALASKNGQCWASNGYFSELYKVSKVSVSNWISSLEKRGYIQTDIFYKDGTKEVEKRVISILTPPIKENFNTPIKENLKGGIKENFNTPIKENFKENNTSINNTSINNNILSDKPDPVPYQEIIDYLNLKANKKFKPTSKDTQRHIKARIKEGFTLDDFKKVIDNKVNDWLNDSKFNEYLRPSTLFGTKFESYLNSDNQSKKVVSFNNTNRFNRPKKQEQVPYWVNQQAGNNHQMQQTSIESEEAIRDRMKNLLRSKDEEG